MQVCIPITPQQSCSKQEKYSIIWASTLPNTTFQLRKKIFQQSPKWVSQPSSSSVQLPVPGTIFCQETKMLPTEAAPMLKAMPCHTQPLLFREGAGTQWSDTNFSKWKNKLFLHFTFLVCMLGTHQIQNCKCMKSKKESTGFRGGSTGKESACKVGDLGSIPGLSRFSGEGIGYLLRYSWASLVAQTIKNLPAVRETWVQEDPLEQGMATHSSILAWRIPMDRGAL